MRCLRGCASSSTTSSQADQLSQTAPADESSSAHPRITRVRGSSLPFARARITRRPPDRLSGVPAPLRARADHPGAVRSGCVRGGSPPRARGSPWRTRLADVAELLPSARADHPDGIPRDAEHCSPPRARGSPPAPAHPDLPPDLPSARAWITPCAMTATWSGTAPLCARGSPPAYPPATPSNRLPHARITPSQPHSAYADQPRTPLWARLASPGRARGPDPTRPRRPKHANLRTQGPRKRGSPHGHALTVRPRSRPPLRSARADHPTPASQARDSPCYASAHAHHLSAPRARSTPAGGSPSDRRRTLLRARAEHPQSASLTIKAISSAPRARSTP